MSDVNKEFNTVVWGNDVKIFESSIVVNIVVFIFVVEIGNVISGITGIIVVFIGKFDIFDSSRVVKGVNVVIFEFGPVGNIFICWIDVIISVIVVFDISWFVVSTSLSYSFIVLSKVFSILSVMNVFLYEISSLFLSEDSDFLM